MPETVSLADYLEGFARARVLCLGDVMLDRYVLGAVERISAEAPIPIMRVSHEEAELGGAGNVARNVAALGARAELIAVVGADDAGGEIERLIDAAGQLDGRLVVDRGRPTTVKRRYVAAGQQLLRADHESLTAVAGPAEAELAAAFRAALPAADVVVLSDYGKGALTDRLLGVVIGEARAAGKPVVADPKRVDFAAYAGASLLKPNVAELAAAAGAPCGSDAEIEAAARRLAKAAAIDAMLVSRSERGLSLVPAEGDAVHLPAQAREVFDVSGAGDTVVATMAVALAAGADRIAAARLANLAGGIVIGKVGTATASRDELAAALLAADVSTSEAKIVSRQAALEAVRRWRARGLKIGFTNGCFDLLHPGHVSLLAQARAACDRLVVGLNSDASTRRLKGADRPVQGEAARAVVLASLASVDLVVVFAEDTPLELLDALRPDLLVKGADYAVEQVVGAAEVRAWGGQVMLAELAEGHSTTETIARLDRSATADD